VVASQQTLKKMSLHLISTSIANKTYWRRGSHTIGHRLDSTIGCNKPLQIPQMEIDEFSVTQTE